ncbi:MAG: hypothetical protein ACYC5O_13640 [Anaerolineae bacterium]
MSEERPTGDAAGTPRDAWRELGQQFEELGRTLANAIRNTLETDENKRRLEALREGAEKMAAEIGDAIEGAVESPEGQKVREEVERTAESARVAGQQAYEEARPHVISALREISEQLQKLSKHMEDEPPSGPTPGATA